MDEWKRYDSSMGGYLIGWDRWVGSVKLEVFRDYQDDWEWTAIGPDRHGSRGVVGRGTESTDEAAKQAAQNWLAEYELALSEDNTDA